MFTVDTLLVSLLLMVQNPQQATWDGHKTRRKIIKFQLPSGE